MKALRRGIQGGYFNLVVTWAVQALLVPLLLHRLGRDAFGLYATLTSLAGYFALLTFGSALTVPRYVAQHAARNDRAGLSAFVSTYFMLHLVIGVAGVLVAVVAGPLLAATLDVPAGLEPLLMKSWWMVVGAWALGLIGGLCQSFLNGLGDVGLANLVNSIRTTMTLIAAWTALQSGGGLPRVLGALLLSSLLGSFVAFAILRHRRPDIDIEPGRASRGILRETLKPAAYYFLMQVAALAVTGTDNVIIGSRLGVGEVAGYAVAFQLWTMTLALLWAGVDALQPFVTRWDVEQDHDRLRTAYLKATAFSVAGAGLFAIAIVLRGREIIALWVGDGVTVDQRVLYVFAGMLLTATPIHTAALVLAGMGRHRPVALGGAVEAVLNVIISLALVGRLGVLGVALGTLISGVVTNAWVAPVAANRAMSIPVSLYFRWIGPALVPGLIAITLML